MDRDEHRDDRQPDELDLELQRGLRALRVDVPPPPRAEGAVVRELRRRGMLPAAMRARWLAGWRGALPMPVRVAAVLLLAAGTFGGGFAAGRSVAGGSLGGAPTPAETPTEAGPRFLLLLYEDANFQRAPAALQAQRAHEYGEWARGLGPTARFIDGEELAEAGRLLEPGGAAGAWRPGSALAAPGAVGGYFVVEAVDLDAAEALARGCPHLVHGGRIEVRPVLRRGEGS